jgi:hypothetical protein
VSDIEVVLGAKNEASAILNQFRNEVGETARGVEFSLKGMAQLAGVGVAVQAIISSAGKLFEFVGEANTAFDETNRVATKLSETLAITGQSDANSGLKALYEDLEKITNIDETKIAGVMNAATRRGASASDMPDMTKAAIGLARIYETDLSSGMLKVEAAIAGNFDGFKGLIPGIQSMTSESQKLAAVSALAQQGLQNQANAANSTAEVVARSKIAWDNLTKSFGELIYPVRVLINEGLVAVKNAIDSVLPKSDSLKNKIQELADTARASAQFAAEGFVTAYTAIETIFANMQTTLEVASASFELFGVRAKSSVEWAFNAIMEYGRWFSDNFLSILRDTAVSASFVVENMGKNLAIGIKRGMGEDIEFVSLLDGFEATTQKLPEIGERAISEVEKALNVILNDGVFKMFDLFDGNLKERLEALRQNFAKNLDVNLNGKDAAVNAASGANAFRDLSAFESRILTKGSSDTPLDRMLDIQTQLLAEQREANRIAREGIKPKNQVNLVKVGGAF